MQRPTLFLTFSMTLILGACGGDKSDTDPAESTTTADTADTTGATGSATDSASTATDTKGSDPTSATGGTDSAGSATDTSNTSTTDAPTTDGPDTDGPDTDTSDPEVVQMCQSFCEDFSECLKQPIEGCVDECLGEFEAAEPACQGATVDLVACFATMTCEQIVAFVENDQVGPCGAQSDSYDDLCSDEACSASVGSNKEGTECSYELTCRGTPPQTMTCVADTCTCTTADQDVGTCPSEAICMDIGAIEDKAKDCCGF